MGAKGTKCDTSVKGRDQIKKLYVEMRDMFGKVNYKTRIRVSLAKPKPEQRSNSSSSSSSSSSSRGVKKLEDYSKKELKELEQRRKEKVKEKEYERTKVGEIRLDAYVLMTFINLLHVIPYEWIIKFLMLKNSYADKSTLVLKSETFTLCKDIISTGKFHPKYQTVITKEKNKIYVGDGCALTELTSSRTFMISGMMNAITYTKKPIVILPISLVIYERTRTSPFSGRHKYSHQNMLVIRRVIKNRILYMYVTPYEPFGETFGDQDGKNYLYNTLIPAMKEWARKEKIKSKQVDSIIISRDDGTCAMGIQQYLKTQDIGYCMVYSLMWLYMTMVLIGYNPQYNNKLVLNQAERFLIECVGAEDKEKEVSGKDALYNLVVAFANWLVESMLMLSMFRQNPKKIAQIKRIDPRKRGGRYSDLVIAGDYKELAWKDVKKIKKNKKKSVKSQFIKPSKKTYENWYKSEIKKAKEKETTSSSSVSPIGADCSKDETCNSGYCGIHEISGKKICLPKHLRKKKQKKKIQKCISNIDCKSDCCINNKCEDANKCKTIWNLYGMFG